MIGILQNGLLSGAQLGKNSWDKRGIACLDAYVLLSIWTWEGYDQKRM